MDRAYEEKKNNEFNNKGKYIVVDINKFSVGSKVFKMIEEMEKIIINEGKMDENIPIDWISNKMMKMDKYKDMNKQQFYGNLWTRIREKAHSGEFVKSDKKDNNSLLYWKDKSDIYVCLSK
jgi:hypothetical protein